MPYKINEPLYTDVNPLSHEGSFNVYPEGDENARYVLAGRGALLSDADAEKYGLKEHAAVVSTTEEEHREELDAKARATHSSRVVRENYGLKPVKADKPDAASTAEPAKAEVIKLGGAGNGK